MYLFEVGGDRSILMDLFDYFFLFALKPKSLPVVKSSRQEGDKKLSKQAERKSYVEVLVGVGLLKDLKFKQQKKNTLSAIKSSRVGCSNKPAEKKQYSQNTKRFAARQQRLVSDPFRLCSSHSWTREVAAV